MKDATIPISPVESVRVTRTETTVRLELLLGGVPVVSRHLTQDAGQRLGDALVFLSSDTRQLAGCSGNCQQGRRACDCR